MNASRCLDVVREQRRSKKDGKLPSIMLVSTPGFAHGWSPLGIARLKSYLRTHDCWADSLPLSVLFTDYVRRRAPRLMSIDAQIGEFGTSWHEVFYSAIVFGHAEPDTLLLDSLKDQHANADIYRTYLDFQGGCLRKPRTGRVIADFRRIKRYCFLLHSFLSGIMKDIDWSVYDAVGFSCLDTQFLTSLYLAKCIRQRCGSKPRIIFGGEFFQSYNVAGISENFVEDIDHIVVGQAEESLTSLLTCIRNEDPAPRVSGVFPNRGAYRYRRNQPDRIDLFPTPDFSELRRSRLSDYSLTLNIGGGCSNSRCSFCPISSVGQHLRPPVSIVEDIRRLYAVHGRRDLNFTDWEINGEAQHFEQFCDEIIKARLHLISWGEINSRNTSPLLLAKMRRAGIRRVQVGIESFNEDTLQLIGKRATLVDNVKVLKWGLEAGLDVVLFNILCNHPLTSDKDAEENLRVMRLIGHLLRPPLIPVLNEVSLYRTSRLYREAEQFHIGEIREFDFYQRLYPSAQLRRDIGMFCLAYDARPVSPLWRKVEAHLRTLKSSPVTLTARKLRNGITVIHDTRGNRRQRYRLNALDGNVIWEAMEDSPSIEEIAERLCEQLETVAEAAERLVRRGLVIQSHNQTLSLPLKAGERSPIFNGITHTRRG